MMLSARARARKQLRTRMCAISLFLFFVLTHSWDRSSLFLSIEYRSANMVARELGVDCLLFPVI